MPIVHLPLPQSVDEALIRLRVDRLFNRYVTDIEEPSKRYEPELKQLITWLGLLQSPTSAHFDNPDAAPDQLQLKAPDSEHPLQLIQPQSVLLLAAMDPNIARLLSLYWVDADGAPNGPEPDVAYDYKVEGLWPGTHKVGCGLVLSLGANRASLPKVHGQVLGNQLPGLRFHLKEPLGRVGLHWPRPQQGQGAVQPVLFDLTRQSDSSAKIFLTEAMPVMVPSPAWDQKDTALFIDTDITLGEHMYHLRPIDLFGQVGKWIESEPVLVQDLEAPPPPVRLRVTATQPGYPWRTDEQNSEPEKENVNIDLRFEFGEAQHHQAPDASSFQLYLRTESLFERHTLNAAVQATEELPNNLKAFTVQISGASGIDLSHFAGGILARHSANGSVLPSDQRLRFRIAQVLPSNRMKLAPTEENFTGGSYELTSDPHLRATWQPWGQPIPLHPVPEITFKVVNTFHAKAANVEEPDSSPNPLTLLPAAHQPQSLADPPKHVEVQLDIELLEPDLFTGGTLRVGTDELPIIYSTSGPAYSGANQKIAARLGLPPGSSVSQNDSLIITPKEDTLVRVFRLEAADLFSEIKTPGGEVAFDIVGSESGETLTYVARIMSALQSADGESAFYVLVRLLSPAALTALASGVQKVRYYTPYQLVLKAVLGAGTTTADNALPLPLPPGQSRQNLYLALTTSDPRKNESPLSSPAQVTAVKPPPTEAPGRPYPCGLTSATEAGYATPPDRQGRATLCLTWDENSPGQPNDLRYEVARALDTTILSAHRRNWLLGQAEIENQLAGGMAVPGTLDATILDQERGLYTVTITGADLGEHKPAAFRGGRLTQNINHFQITANVVAENGALEMVLRPMSQDAPVVGTVTLYSPPDYSTVRDNADALRQLAAEIPDAFSLVTGVPIRETQFRDEIPGIGRNCYFYRVRAVDIAENRSAWSEVSVPFYQVDLLPPSSPEIVRIRRGSECDYLILSHPQEPGVRAYCLLRRESDGELHVVDTFAFEPRTDEHPLSFAPLRPTGLLVDLRYILKQAEVFHQVKPELVGIYSTEVDRDAPPEEANILSDEAQMAHGMVKLHQHSLADRPLIARLKVGDDAFAWSGEIEAWVEIPMSKEYSSQGVLLVQTIKETVYSNKVIILRSQVVEVKQRS